MRWNAWYKYDACYKKNINDVLVVKMMFIAKMIEVAGMLFIVKPT
jgi:hypothetical protein